LLGHTVLQPEETWDIGFIPRAEKRQHRVWGKPPAGTELVRSYPVVLVSVDFDRAGSPISYYATGNLTPQRARHNAKLVVQSDSTARECAPMQASITRTQESLFHQETMFFVMIRDRANITINER